MKKAKDIIFWILLALLAMSCINLGLADAAVVTRMEWDAVTTNSDGSPCTDLDGYKVYCTLVMPDFGVGQDVGNVLTVNFSTVTAMSVAGLYTCVVTAYDVWGSESAHSNSVKVLKQGSTFYGPDALSPSFPVGVIVK